jgi:hypothetical protein
MVTLKDYLGALVTGINQARVLADIDSANIAHAYADDQLLRNFPAPRFRASKIEITIPVAIDHLEETIRKDYQPFEKGEFNSLVFSTLQSITKVDSFEGLFSTSLRKTITIQTDLLESGLKEGRPKDEMLNQFCHSISGQYISIVAMQNEKEPDRLARLLGSKKENLQEALAERLAERLEPEIREPEKVADMYQAKVIVEASRLKEIRTENLVQIKMTLNEEGMEWHTMKDENGEIRSKLLPE